MDEWLFYRILLGVFSGIAICVFVLLFFISAPYGRYSRKGWGPLIQSRWAWLLMEVPASLLFLLYFRIGTRKAELVPVIFFLLWEMHYFHRAFLYPFSLRSSRKVPVSVILFALVFNTANTYLQARWIYTFSPESMYTTAWLKDIRFITGVFLFMAGFAIAKLADRELRTLRRPGETGYKIPFGGFYRWISCPNYLGEILEWAGWALAVWSLPGAVFFLWTAANLFPRAHSHHIWYKKTFFEYPPERKAIIPLVY